MSTSDVVTGTSSNNNPAVNNRAVILYQGARIFSLDTPSKSPELLEEVAPLYTNRFNKRRNYSATATNTTPAPDCANSTSSVKMMGWYAGDRILSPIGYAPYGNETYVYGDEVVRYETGAWLYTNLGAEIVRAYSDAEWPWLVEWPSPYTSEKICDPANITTTTTTTTTPPPTNYWEVTVEITTDNQNFNIYLSGLSVDISINWGDGTTSAYNSTGWANKTYSAPGSYDIRITGSFGSRGNVRFGMGSSDKPRLKSTSVIGIMGGLHNFKNTFAGCTGLTSIPSNLFIYYPDVNLNVFDSTFSRCSGLTSIPEDLFKNQTRLGRGEFFATFYNCTGLTTIPENIFRYNTLVGSASFNYTFSGCTSLTNIPEDIFRYNTDVDRLSFVYVFDRVTIPTSTYNGILTSLNTYLGSKSGMQFNAGNSAHSGSGTTARDALVANGWTILDGSDLVLNLDSQNLNSYAGSGTDWYDLSGFNNNAKLINGAYHDGQHIIFDGSNDYAEVLNNVYINNCLNANFTFDIWVFMNAPQIRSFGKIISKGGYFAPGFNGISLATNNNVISAFWQYRTSNGSVSTLLETNLTSNGWTNLVYTRSNGLLSLYKNGQFVSSINNTYDLRSNYNLRIGSNYQPDNQAKQKVAVLKQYRTSLTSQEILDSYNAYSNRFV
jgi:hypothetical protein